jgi:hypothetical protein
MLIISWAHEFEEESEQLAVGRRDRQYLLLLCP